MQPGGVWGNRWCHFPSGIMHNPFLTRAKVRNDRDVFVSGERLAWVLIIWLDLTEMDQKTGQVHLDKLADQDISQSTNWLDNI